MSTEWSTENTKPLRLVSEVTNGGEDTIQASEPYTVTVELEGVADMLFHRWNNESIAEKKKAPKNSAAKTTDDIESFVWRDANNHLCVPGEYLRGSIINAAKFKQDPRSPRKSAMDLYKAGVVSLTTLAPIYAYGKTVPTMHWDYEDKRRVTVQRNGITRTRPAFRHGWKVSIDLMVSLGEYISPANLREAIDSAGRFVGIADFRPTYGRFVVSSFKILDA